MGTFDLTIISDPAMAVAPNAGIWDLDYQAVTSYDADLLKPALLFADSVRLITTRGQLRDLSEPEILSANTFTLPYLITLLNISRKENWDTASKFGIKPEWLPPPEEAQLLHDRYNIPIRNRYDDNENGREILVSFAQRYDRAVNAYVLGHINHHSQRLEILTSQDLADAEDSGLVQIVGWTDIHTFSTLPGIQSFVSIADELWQQAAAKIESSSSAIMLEPGSSLLLELTSGNSPATSELGADRIAVSALGILPGLKTATIADVLTLRDALSDYLPKFRAAAIDLSQQVRESDPVDPRDALHIIDEQWHKEISPALPEMRFVLERGSFQRHIIEEFSAKDSWTTVTGVPCCFWVVDR